MVVVVVVMCMLRAIASAWMDKEGLLRKEKIQIKSTGLNIDKSLSCPWLPVNMIAGGAKDSAGVEEEVVEDYEGGGGGWRRELSGVENAKNAKNEKMRKMRKCKSERVNVGRVTVPIRWLDKAIKTG